MKLAPKFLGLNPQRRAVAFEQAAIQRGANPIIIEKDFWVCWLIGVIFSDETLAPHFVFKGGTSLSKVYGVIDRFSEDVDLSISPQFVGADANGFDGLTSRTQRDEAVVEMQRLCSRKVKEHIEPLLENILRENLGTSADGKWLTLVQDERSQSPILYFHYPATQTAGFAYVRREVKLELGSITDQQPVGRHGIRPWVAEQFPALFADWQCRVIALELSRTFWEKATILHAEFHRPENQPIPDRYARHYSDMARLLEHADAEKFLSDQALCTRVAEWKSKVFARSWARYDLARPGSFKLAPPAYRHAFLKSDYAEMRPMFLREPPLFERIMEQLTEAEKKINGLAS